MSSPTLSNISQNDAKILEKQWQEMQQRYEEEQQPLLQLEEVVRLHQAKHATQKARREAEEKARKETKRQKVVKEKKKKKRILEYLQQLWDEVLEEEAALLEGAEGFQIVGSKCKKITTGDKKRQWFSKKAKEKQQEKYRSGATVKMGGANPCKRCVSTRHNCLVHHSR